MAIVEDYLTSLPSKPISSGASTDDVREYLSAVTFDRGTDPVRALTYVAEGFERFHVHNAHPRYMGLFLPASSTMGIAADTLAALFNPVLASRQFSPFAVEMEEHLLRLWAERFGYNQRETDGVFASGGSECNYTALVSALCHSFPSWRHSGVRGLTGEPVLYVSAEGHHSFVKAARLAGLGDACVRWVPVDGDLRLDLAALEDIIRADRAAGRQPFLIVATAGTTNAGIVDPIAALAEIAAREEMWFHVDAAWGGAAVLLPELREEFTGIERADSIAFDPHKWLSVPMGAGMFLTRHSGFLEKVFSVDDPYMPRPGSTAEPADFYRRSMQWARRFIGLKLFLTLAVAGWDGYRAVIRHQVAMGALLRDKLEEAGFVVENRTPLPVICFTDRDQAGGADDLRTRAIAAHVVKSGRAWISTTRIGPRGRMVLRAAVTSFRTSEGDVEEVLGAIQEARRSIDDFGAEHAGE